MYSHVSESEQYTIMTTYLFDSVLYDGSRNVLRMIHDDDRGNYMQLVGLFA
jgi:hypothetical protein